MKRWWSIILIILFILGVFGLFALAGSVTRSFMTKAEESQTFSLSPTLGDTVILASFFQPNTSLNSDLWQSISRQIPLRVLFSQSKDSLYHIKIDKSARGKNTYQAKRNLSYVSISYQQDNNHLQIPGQIEISHGVPFRDQKATMTLLILVGKWVYFQSTDQGWWQNSIFYFNGAIHGQIENSEEYDEGDLYQMQTSGKLKKEN